MHGGTGAQEEEEEEEMLQQLRSRATELLLKEEWNDYINLYSHFISTTSTSTATFNGGSKLHKALPSAFSNRAEARLRIRDLPGALADCQRALDIEPNYVKALLCKGKTLLELHRYSQASETFQLVLSLQTHLSGNNEALRELIERSRKLEVQSKTGVLDISDWIINGLGGSSPELAEYVGPVEVRRSMPSSGRGLFATKNIEAGTPLVITKAVVIGRGILPENDRESGVTARLVLWKDFVDKVLDVGRKCKRTLRLMYTLFNGEDDESELQVPEMALFNPNEKTKMVAMEEEEELFLDVERILKVLDVNCLMEDAECARVLGKKSGYSGVGLWILPSFVNHSCSPNARRLHIGDTVIVHASRDVKAGEEIVFAYFDVLAPVKKRKEMSKRWGFECRCERCRFEEEVLFKEEMRKMEVSMENGLDAGEVVVGLEEGMKKWMVSKAKEKGLLRASFFAAYADVYKSDKMMRRWGKRIPTELSFAESMAGAVGGDERVMKMVLERLKKKRKSIASDHSVIEMEKALKLGKGVYGKVMKKQSMKLLFELHT
ncbi:putative [histone H3]-lysine(4) N-trimethyltransferase chromatin remodeling SET family [Dioscorea sansibarensis]